ncbi:hypothetical protein [Streptomyces sp. NBC_00893]|uniref:hypothetical protein n=1 Tax=unclassified Streptomyces TaxID=2593676 RepID=UPI002B1D80C0|nr:hypothetical protein [Streptomyces sp. NBC_00893]
MVDSDSDTCLVCPTAAALQHVRGGVDALDVQSVPTQSEQGVTVSAAQFQGWGARVSHEGRIRLGVRGEGLQGRVGIRDDSGIEISWLHLLSLIPSLRFTDVSSQFCRPPGREIIAAAYGTPMICSAFSAQGSAWVIEATSEY